MKKECAHELRCCANSLVFYHVCLPSKKNTYIYFIERAYKRCLYCIERGFKTALLCMKRECAHELGCCASWLVSYGVATISRLSKNIGLFCKRAL